MRKKSKVVIVLAIIIVVSLVYNKINKQQNLAEIVASSSIIDYKTALPKSGFVLVDGYVSANNPPQIPNIDINTDSTIALILNIEVYQLKETTTVRTNGRYAPANYNYNYEMEWCNNDIIDNSNEECDGKMPSEYKAQIYMGSDFKFRDSIQLEQDVFTDDLYNVLRNQYSKSVIEYDYYIIEYLDTNLFTIMEFSPPNINNKKIFKVYNWIGGNGLKEVYKEIGGYTSYFKKYGSLELGQTIETDSVLENNANFKQIEQQKYFQYYFYGNDPNKPVFGDIRIQILAIESDNRHSINSLIGTASDNMLKPFDNHYYLNADKQKFDNIIKRYKR